jgi:phenol 2-monooxygenase
MADDLARHSKRGIDVSAKLLSRKIDEDGSSECPVKFEVETTNFDHSPVRIVRAKHIVGADGAHSSVRRATGLNLVGESRDHIWGVV